MCTAKTLEEFLDDYYRARHMLAAAKLNFKRLLNNDLDRYPGNYFHYTRKDTDAFINACYQVLQDTAKKWKPAPPEVEYLTCPACGDDCFSRHGHGSVSEIVQVTTDKRLEYLESEVSLSTWYTCSCGEEMPQEWLS
jgi:hypothetical protein